MRVLNWLKRKWLVAVLIGICLYGGLVILSQFELREMESSSMEPILHGEGDPPAYQGL